LHPEFHKKNLEQVVSILLDNDYPLKFIFDMIRQESKNLSKKCTTKKLIHLKIFKKKKFHDSQFHI